MECDKCKQLEKSCEILQKRLRERDDTIEYLEEVIKMSASKYMKAEYARIKLIEESYND